MLKYRRKPEFVEAVQWFKLGDHPDVRSINKEIAAVCGSCKAKPEEHGLLGMPIGNSNFETRNFTLVCPGNYIVSYFKSKQETPKICWTMPEQQFDSYYEEFVDCAVYDCNENAEMDCPTDLCTRHWYDWMQLDEDDSDLALLLVIGWPKD